MRHLQNSLLKNLNLLIAIEKMNSPQEIIQLMAINFNDEPIDMKFLDWNQIKPLTIQFLTLLTIEQIKEAKL